MGLDLARATGAGDPAEFVGTVLVFQAGVAGQRAEATGRHTAGDAGGDHAAVATGGQAVVAIGHAISELHREIAGVAEAPAFAIAVHFQAAPGILFARRRRDG